MSRGSHYKLIDVANLLVQIIYELLGSAIEFRVNQRLTTIAYRQFVTVDSDVGTETFFAGDSVSTECIAVGNGIRIERIETVRMPDFKLCDG